MMTHRWGPVLSGLARAAMLAAAGFMLMGSLAVIGAHTSKEPVTVDSGTNVTTDAITETAAARAADERPEHDPEHDEDAMR